MSSWQRNKKEPRKNKISIQCIQTQLFSQLEEIQQDFLGYDEELTSLKHQIQEQKSQKKSPLFLLNQAKQLTRQHQDQITQIKKHLKSTTEHSPSFLTGVGLYVENDPTQHQVDDNQLLRSLDEVQMGDLTELKKMIKKTQTNLRDYSESVYEIQSEVVMAADKYQYELDLGLTNKINKCDLEKTFYKEKNANKPKERSRVMSSSGPRKHL